MRLLVTGDRNWSDRRLLHSVLDSVAASYLWDVVLVHGAARGADRMADDWAKAHDVPVEPHPANWDHYGNAAGPIRNTEMLKSGLDLVLAFHDDIRHSKGTRHMVGIARDAGVPVKLIFHEPTATISDEAR